jgi:hypothetical protein
VRKLYYGVAVVEMLVGDVSNIHANGILTLATSEDEAVGWATSETFKRFPQGSLRQVNMKPVADEFITAAFMDIPLPARAPLGDAPS